MHSENKIPDKFYFKIGEVSDLTGLPSSVLRFWESEFSGIKPKRTSSGQRLYKKNDIKQIFIIKNLLYKEKFTIQGAKQYLKSKICKKNKPPETVIMDQIRSELKSIRDMLL